MQDHPDHIASDARGGNGIPDSRVLFALAHAFSYPGNGIGETLGPLRSLAEETGRKDFDDLFEASCSFADATDAKLAYTRLFIGSFKMEAPPYASYYLSDDCTLNGRAAAEVESVYNQFGLKLERNEKAPADHLRYMLHFLALLAARHEETDDEAFAEAYHDFKDAFITPWYGTFRSLVDKSAEGPYYPKLAELIERIV